MDRRKRALLVQFWLTVETFKDPLESVDSESEGEDSNRPLTSTTVKEDVKMVYELYFSDRQSTSSPLLSAIPRKYVTAIQNYVLHSSSDPDQTQAKRARQTVLLAQRQIEGDMADDFEDFKRSELWFRVTSEQLRSQNFPAHADPVPDTLARLRQTPSSMSTPMLRPRKSSFRSPDTVRSRIYPTFILPINPSSPRSQSNSPRLSRPRLPSFGSDVDVHSPNLDSLSNSIESLPSHSKPVNNALDFLISDPLSPTPDARAPLFDDPEITREENAHAERMEAIQAALTDLIADENRHDQLKKPGGTDSGGTSHSSPHIGGKQRELAPDVSSPEHIPSPILQSLSDGENESELVGEDPYVEREERDEARFDVHIAAPGDLQLSHDIARLGEKINKLQSQEVLLEALTRKAELTGDLPELKLLSRSKASLAKEIREMSFQKTQYEQQEMDNRLIPGRTRIFITSSVTTETEGKQVVRYLVETQQLNAENKVTSGWVVSRRYNEFFAMHQRLKERYVLVKNLDFPGKRLVTSMSNSFVDNRKAALEKYLQVSHYHPETHKF